MQSVCDSWSTNWHRDKCFAPVLRLPSTHHLISSWRRAMEPVQAAAPKAVSSNGKTTKKRTKCQASTGSKAVATELLSTTRSPVCLHGGRLSHQQASKTHPHRSVRPRIAGTFLDEDHPKPFPTAYYLNTAHA